MGCRICRGLDAIELPDPARHTYEILMQRKVVQSLPGVVCAQITDGAILIHQVGVQYRSYEPEAVVKVAGPLMVACAIAIGKHPTTCSVLLVDVRELSSRQAMLVLRV